MAPNPFETDLDRTPANFQQLSPLSFLARSAYVYPNHLAIVHGDVRRTYGEFYARARRLASALAKRGIKRGDTVAVMAPNVPEVLEAHFGIPMVGGILNALNIRLDAQTIAFILDHGEAKVLITDREFSPVIAQALKMVANRPLVIDIDDPLYEGGELLGEMDYEAFIASGDPDYAWSLPEDEWQSISLNYTSGTTGNPKGVVYHHRGAYLNAIGNTMEFAMGKMPVYLWTLPMFHCNGWCFPWTVTAMAGTHVCLRRVEPKAMYEAMAKHGVTHFNGAPVVLNMLINAPDEVKAGLKPGIKAGVAGAAPPAAIIAGMENLGFQVTHLYGLTETYGPVVTCAWHGEWDALPLDERARLKARQGVRYQVLEGLSVIDPETMIPVPGDGQTMGEIMMRGNVIMKGYLKNPKATAEALAGGWYHTGDLAVMHPDGYIEIKDRSKDIIISGGENISTIEVESVLYRHPAVMEAAVVAKPSEKWGETPCAVVNLKPGMSATAEEIIAFCRANLAHYKCPRDVLFAELPKTSTGKIQKFALRDLVRDAGK